MTFSTRKLSAIVALVAVALGAAACGTAATPQRVRPVAAVPPPAAVPTDAEVSAAAAELDAVRRGLETQTTEMTARRAEIQRLVAAHVADRMTPAARRAFPFVMFISKSGEGPIAQHAFLFKSDEYGELTPLDTWHVSTGRENREVSPRGERKFTSTPAGVYQFDAGRFIRLHKSNAWESDMPWAMFFGRASWGRPTGYALHAALDKYVPNLGQRASAGCIRLLPANAERLYKMLLAEYRGPTKTVVTRGSTIDVGGGSYSGIQAIVIVEDLDGYALLGEQAPAKISMAAP